MRGLTSIKEKKLPAGATAGASDYFIYGKHTDCSRNVDKNAPEGPKTVFTEYILKNEKKKCNFVCM